MVIDLSLTDRSSRDGAKVVGEMMGINAIMIGGNKPTKTNVSSNGREGIDKIKTFVYNHGSLDCSRGAELMGTICEAYETKRDELMYRPGDVVAKVILIRI